MTTGAIAQVDGANNIGRCCTLAGDDRRWQVVAAIDVGYFMVRLVGGCECRPVWLVDMHNLS